MNSFPHHISTPSRPPNIDFPKIVDFTNKEISRKWCSNSEMIEKARLLQESITHPKTDFELVANKKLTFNYCTHCLRAKLRFWELRTAFLRKNWLITNINNQNDWERCWVKNKNSKCCAHCLRAKVCFWEFRASFLRK